MTVNLVVLSMCSVLLFQRLADDVVLGNLVACFDIASEGGDHATLNHEFRHGPIKADILAMGTLANELIPIIHVSIVQANKKPVCLKKQSKPNLCEFCPSRAMTHSHTLFSVNIWNKSRQKVCIQKFLSAPETNIIKDSQDD